MATYLKMEFAQRSPEERAEDDGFSSISVFWEAKNNPAGLWVKYSENVSHRHAFSVLAEGMWKAMQDPVLYDVGRSGPNVDEEGNPAPYATLTDDIEP